MPLADAVAEHGPKFRIRCSQLSHLCIGEEIARVLGGGVVPASLVLMGGDPGIGKSTLLLQVPSLLLQRARSDMAVLPPASGSLLSRAARQWMCVWGMPAYQSAPTELDPAVT